MHSASSLDDKDVLNILLSVVVPALERVSEKQFSFSNTHSLFQSTYRE